MHDEQIHIPLVCESVLSLVRTIFHVNFIDHPAKQTKKNVNRKMVLAWHTSQEVEFCSSTLRNSVFDLDTDKKNISRDRHNFYNNRFTFIYHIFSFIKYEKRNYYIYSYQNLTWLPNYYTNKFNNGINNGRAP